MHTDLVSGEIDDLTLAPVKISKQGKRYYVEIPNSMMQIAEAMRGLPLRVTINVLTPNAKTARELYGHDFKAQVVTSDDQEFDNMTKQMRKPNEDTETLKSKRPKK